jgi:signal transduction histidine kinase
VAERRWFDPALAVGLTLIALLGFFAEDPRSSSPLAAALLVLMGATVVARRKHAAAATGVAVVLLLVAGVAGFEGNYPPGSATLIPFLLSYSCGAHAPFRDGLLAVIGLAVGAQLAEGFSEFPNVEILFVTMAPWWVGWEVGKRRRLVAQLEQRTRELEAARDDFVELSLRRERARIARELHDIVAHHLAVIVVQAGAGRMAGARADTPPAERLAGIRESGDQALAEMSRLVDVIHADSGARRDGAERLRSLVEDARSGGLDVDLAGAARLPPELEENALRIVQEGLTNAMKHAPGARVEVRLALTDDAVEIDVRDHGGGGPSALSSTGAGLGLDGMRERIESLGGSLEAGPCAEGGWRIQARLPAAPTPVG